eukprot:1615432-Amphidinium_carterae.1
MHPIELCEGAGDAAAQCVCRHHHLWSNVLRSRVRDSELSRQGPAQDLMDCLYLCAIASYKTTYRYETSRLCLGVKPYRQYHRAILQHQVVTVAHEVDQRQLSPLIRLFLMVRCTVLCSHNDSRRPSSSEALHDVQVKANAVHVDGWSADCRVPGPVDKACRAALMQKHDDEQSRVPVGLVVEESLKHLRPLDRQLLLFAGGSNLPAVRWLLHLGASLD